jgi:hypothetical protein
MNEDFRKCVESLHPSFERLVAMQPLKSCNLPTLIPRRGVYLFSETDVHLYVGRTNRLRARLQEHCRASSGHNSAPFAFLLAREQTGRITATYKSEGGREAMCLDATFAAIFTSCKLRVRNMDVRFVEEIDPIRQALLEMYVAVALKTPHNSFENH